MTECKYDRKMGDFGNIAAFEHVNLQVPDMNLATLFYITGLGLTRDPYMMTGIHVMYVNCGHNQFHLLVGSAQVVSGLIGLVVPSLDLLERRLNSIEGDLTGTSFSFERRRSDIKVTCPWGNRFICHCPDPRFGRMTLGLAYLELDVRPKTASGVSRFYQEILGALPLQGFDKNQGISCVKVGPDQELRFKETDAVIRPFDGHHIQIYVTDFSGPHRKLLDRKLITEESNAYQYRFDKIVDLDSGEVLTLLEHEVRTLAHPLFARPLVNRNPEQTNMDYVQGHDAWIPPKKVITMDDPRQKAILAERESRGRKGLDE